MSTRLWAALVLVLTIAPAFPQSRRLQDRPVRLASRGTRGAVAAGSESAAEAGLRLYHQGGNAVDAGVATMLAASVVEFSHFGFGGEAPILVRTKDGKVRAIAGVGTMPRAASADFFRQHKIAPDEMTNTPEKNGMRAWVPVAGILPALVPGMVDAALVTLRDFGTKTLAEVMQPALDLADGWPIDEIRSNYIERTRKNLNYWPSSRRVFLPNGRVPRTGEIFRQPDLARTMRSMVEAEKRARQSGQDRARALDAVRDFFYRGEIARRIDAFSKDNNGLLRYEDMAAFRLRTEEPVSTTFQGYTVYKPGFWSQGPALLQALNIVEGMNLAGMGINSPDYIHHTVEALKLAYADRDTYYGDPQFNRIPAERLLSKAYAEERRGLIGPLASHEFRPGQAGADPPQHPSQVHMASVKIDDALMAKDTTCVNAIDRDGIAFSATPSGAWLPSVIAGDTGIPLTQRAQSFLLIPGHPNELAGGKRPRVTLSPTLASRPDGSLLALSTPGGDNQEQSLLQVLLDVVLFGMNAQSAVEAPRFQTRHLVSSFDNHAMNPGDLLLDERIAPEVMTELRRRRHRVETRSRLSSGAAPVLVRLIPGGIVEAGADPYGWRVSKAW